MKKSILLLGLIPAIVSADQVYNDDLIVAGNTCVGIDCSLDQPFPHSPLELKENNLRLRLLDTDSPVEVINTIGPDYTRAPAELGHSWSLVANDSANGGPGYFAFEQYSDPAPRLSDGTAIDYNCTNTVTGVPISGEANKDDMTVTIVGTIPEGLNWEDQWCAFHNESIVRNGVRFTVGSTATSGGVSIGFGSDNAEGTVSVGNDSKLRRLANLAEALDDVDVLTVAQMDVYAEQKAALAKLNAKLDQIETVVRAMENPRSGGSLPAGLLATVAMLLMWRRRV